MASKVATSPGHPQARVRFNLTEMYANDDDWTFTNDIHDDNISKEELVRYVERMRSKLTQAQIDLSGEKALRRRNEQNLFKIAKELVKRAQDGDVKDAQITKLTNTIAKMEHQMRAAIEAAASYQKESMLLKEKFQIASREYERLVRVKMEEHKEEVEDAWTGKMSSPSPNKTTWKEVQIAVEGETKGGKIVQQTSKTNLPNIPSSRRQWIARTLYVVITLGVAIVAGLFGMDVLCAPIVPGLSYYHPTDDVTTLDAPWWAPSSLKEDAFGVCGKRSRIRLEWSLGKRITAFDLGSIDDEPKVLWTKYADYVIPNWNGKLEFWDKSGAIRSQVDSPWKSSSLS